ncbi:prolyl oligopeptidase family serine peptidase [uncultured Sanguibacteroides sp.]|uniref:S9 family peptidase n=1 Tax=uncultured Sanguibacteroides sp. TaxID=1635151 RepID=UPI0025D08F45|nr:prolyl oligopeptidase family serine peptidase [uncultured Sanguibacteroides sp.]
MKKLFLFVWIIFSLQVQGQVIREWMSLPPIPVEMPAFHDQKNVNNLLFTPVSLLKFSTLSVENLSPAPGRSEQETEGLQWKYSDMADGEVRYSSQEKTPSVVYNAVYMANTEWMNGSMTFYFNTNAEVFIDGEKVLTFDTYNEKEKTISKEINRNWIPGKHTVIVKSLVLSHTPQTLFSASFKAGDDFKNIPVEFTLSPMRGKTIYDVLNGTRVENIQTSPSGKYLLLSKTEIIKGKSNRITYLYRLSDKEIIYSFYGKEASDITWVPGQDKLSFLIQEGKGHSLYTYDPETRYQKCLVKADHSISGYVWSPDRTYLLYYQPEEYSEKEWELRKVEGMMDRQPHFRTRYFLYKYDFKNGLHTRLTWGNQTTSIMDISHDGKKVIIATNRPDYNEYPYSKQSIYLMDIPSNKTDTLWQDRLVDIYCSFSPDDKQLLVSGGANAFGNTGVNIRKGQIVNEYDTQLFIYDLATHRVNPITKYFNPSVSGSYWHKDGSIYIIAGDTDYIHLFRYQNGKIEQVNCPGDIVQRLSLSEQGDWAVYTASDQSYPARVYTLNLTNLNTQLWDNPAEEQYKDVVFGEVRDWDYQYKKNTTIDGRYYLPANFDPTKKYPMIVYYYGGTSPVERTFGGRWPFNLYAANGYVVYVMQPSGTTGFGQEFSARHQNNWGIITADEIIACTKAFLKAHPFVDPQKVGCMGASYGGFTTMLLQTRTDIFACAISHAGISSISSYWGEGYWGYSYSTQAAAHSFPWNRKDIYVNQSPLFNADKVKKPILLLHGTADVNVPTGESIQFYTALKLLGKEVDLVLIKNADHTVVDYNQRIIWNNTILSYFAKYLKNQPAWWENMYKDKNL